MAAVAAARANPDAAAALPAALRGRLAARLAGLALLLALVALAQWRSWHGTRLDSLTVDEAWHIVAGVEYAREGDFRLNPEHPPLTKRWVGAFMPDAFQLRPKGPLSGKGAERDFVEETFYLDNDFRAAQARAHLAMRALNGLLLLGVGLLLWHALGLGWAAGALAFIALEPTVGAHLPLVMTDLPVALALTMAALCAGLWLWRPSWRWAAGLGLAMGLALGAKHSALPGVAVLGALCTVVAVARALRPRRRDAAVDAAGASVIRALVRSALQLALATALAVATLWAHYDFRFHAGPDGRDDFNRPMADKIADLRVDHWREAIAFADAHRLAPRAWLWGLADTVRAGVEGRGQNLNLLWGTMHEGSAPWSTFPSYIAAKLPLALLAMALLGGVALALRRDGGMPDDAARRRAAGLALGVLALGHLLALAQSQGTYAGVRHALPVVVVLGVLAAAVFAVSAGRMRRAIAVAGFACLAAALAMTIREPRLWEYHNELARGSADAWRLFGNEGLDLGQRAFELADFNARVMAPSGLPVYSGYWFGEEQARALGLAYTRRVDSLDDTNVEGIYEGWFIVPMDRHVPMPQWNHDPAAYFAGLERVARLGYVEIWRGRQVVPQSRAFALSELLVEYVHKEGGGDWEKVAARSREVLAVLPHRFPDAIELGSALLRLGRREDAIAAYRQPFAADRGALDALTRQQLEQRIAELERGDDLATLRPLPNPWTE
jgi:hypothetical protein